MIDNLLRQEIAALTPQEIDESRIKFESNSFRHDILGAGINAIAHVYLMSKALRISAGKTSLKEFVDHYSLKMDTHEGTKEAVKYNPRALELVELLPITNFMGPLQKLETDGLFIPLQAYSNGKENRSVTYFESDYMNYLRGKKDCEKLIERCWKLDDLKDKDLVMGGIHFGKTLWSVNVKAFQEEVDRKPQLSELKAIRVAEKLIGEYSAYISTV